MSLGPYLRNVREQKGITLSEIEARTNIRRDIIQTIERGDYHALPDSSHTKYLIRTYADALQLNSDDLFERYGDEIPTKEAVYKERKENKVDKDMLYLKKTIYTFLIVIGVLFVLWLVLLQVGGQGDYFRKSPVYDEVEVSPREESGTFNVTLERVEDNTAFYTINTSNDINVTFKGDGSTVNMTDDNNNTYVNETINDETYLIQSDASELFIAVEDNDKLSIFVNDVELEDDEVQNDGTLFYHFTIERE
ncbi:RodZ family helix-turn-helix domain-containing protein [Nosocomiicoccus sp. HMSC059G07]|uniref:helix-turn-helix domain-containing protein n=1 Tax=Nosocomiicoccus sp. HMSC059G07 TaxID=1739531 RepID=UPI0008A2AE9C|nr:helix-turn-helix domain-containing protein [Nosocomiicoccus sp. HMSC059G07]OFO50915.1 hypothetical protein HMPREF3029_08210 [Nosocomiicoccus sp. HMSC059G07]